MKYLNHNLEAELILMRDYKIKPDELYAIKVILLAQDGDYDYLRDYVQILEGQFRLILTTLQSKGIILKSYKFPKEGSSFIPEDVQFNQNFLKKYYRSAFEMGEELFYTYPQSCVVNNQVFNLRSVSHKFDSLEDAFAKYAKQIKNNPEIHQEIIDNIKGGIENGYNFTTLDRFIVDRAYEALKAFKEGNTINYNLESTQLL